METKTWLYKGKKQSYRSIGSGPKVLLLHGFAEDGSIWREQFDLFPGHQLLVPDLPGSGSSDAVDDISMEGLADVIHQLVTTEAGGEKVTLIGHSMGGYITLAFAEKYGEALNAFSLFHSTAFADNEKKIEARKKGISSIRENGAEPFLKTSVPALYSPETKAEKPGLVEEQMTSASRISPDVLVAYYEAIMVRPDRTAVLRDTKLPVLFVLGKWDTAVPPEEAWKQGHLPGTVYIQRLDHSGHLGMVEESEKTNNILTEFVAMVEKLA